LKEFTDLKYSREALWYKKLGNKLIKYSININYISIEFNKDSSTINLSKDTEFSFSNAPDVVSKEFDDRHTIALKKINNKWLIDKDIAKSELDSSNSNINMKISVTNAVNESNALDQKISSLKSRNIDNDINEYKEIEGKVKVKQSEEKKNNNNLIKTSSLITPMGSYGGHTWQVDYNRMAAVNYAHKWANSYNPLYVHYDSDCTNFVSQCIYAGAPKMNRSAGWYYLTPSIGGPAWINVKNLWNFLINNNGTGPISMDNTHYLDMDYGDPIEFWSYYEGDYSHAVIVTKIDDYGGIYYSGHSNFRYDYSLSSAYATGAYNTSKTRTAHIFGYNN